MTSPDDEPNDDTLAMPRPLTAIKGRGAVHNPKGRFEAQSAERESEFVETESPQTVLAVDHSRTVLTFNRSPDLPFDRSINPYRGCEHGCVYCYARPSHAFLGLSPGLDFETRLFHKPNAPEQLRRELARPGYRVAPIAFGVNTDAYQPVERRLQLTRRLVEVLAETRHPFMLITKATLIERDLDLLAPLAAEELVQVGITLTTLDEDLSRRLEPRAAGPKRRLRTIQTLREAGIPVTVSISPVIPALTDHELERILDAAREAGAVSGHYGLLRLPHELTEVFTAWLQTHVPGRAEHVLSLLQQMHGGAVYRAEFGVRRRGTGAFADLLAQRFRIAARRLGMDAPLPPLDTTRFRPPHLAGQLDLFSAP